jgi:uncharacterized protein (TIGR03435 family)
MNHSPTIARRATLLFVAVACFAQQSPEFEAASIKINSSGASGAGLGFPPGRLTATNVPMRVVVSFAYGIQDSKLVGGPDWLSTVRYDVVATAQGAPPPDQIRLMVQAMLADRLKLAVHREKREAQIYELVPAKSGLKLETSAAGSCQVVDRDHPPAPRTAGTPPPRYCGNMGLGPGQINGWGVPTVRLAEALSNMLGRTVIDKTGAAGNYNIVFRFTPDQAIMPNMAGPANPGNAPAASDPANPDIFTALQEQLGLKLDSARGEVEMLVVDHVERPSEN